MTKTPLSIGQAIIPLGKISDEDPASQGIVSGGSFRPFRQIDGTGEL